MCLGFTGPAVAWAEPARDAADPAYDPLAHATPDPKSWPVLGAAKNAVEDPYAPHVTNGNTVRLGTAVGFLYGQHLDSYALGVTAAVGHRYGRFAIDAEAAYLNFASRGESNKTLGNGERVGVLARFDVIRLDSHVVGGNSMLAIYVEGGAAVAWNHWNHPGTTDVTNGGQSISVIPDDSKRVEGQGGFGIELDHRLQEPRGISRIGWFLGWRLAMAPHASEAASVCRGTSCRSATPMADATYTDRSMLFQSSISVTW